MNLYREEYPGIYRGVVLSNDDPLHLGRCKIRVSAVNTHNPSSPNILPWARPVSRGTVNENRGSYDIPDVGDMVWVVFEGANKRYPVYLGGVYAVSDIPVSNDKIVLYTEEGDSIVYNRNTKTYSINAGSSSVVLSRDSIVLKGDLKIDGNIDVAGSMNLSGTVDTGVGISIPEVTVGESYSPDIIPPPGGGSGNTGSGDSSGTEAGGSSGGGTADFSEKSLEVTGGIGINRLSDSKAFCDSLITKISVLCRDENGGDYMKNLSVNKYLASNIEQIFKDIYDNTTFRVRSSDTGAYNYRKINGSSKLSYHSYGVAIDINWSANPYSSSAGGSDDDIHIRSINHPVVQIFLSHGWGWGGTYNDLMHFSYFNGH